jgi:transposase-like protein
MIDKDKDKYKCALRKSYSKAFKLKVVREVACGLFTKDGAKYGYGIAGNSTVLRWMRSYGSFPPEKKFQMKKKKRCSLEALAAARHRADLEQAHLLPL